MAEIVDIIAVLLVNPMMTTGKTNHFASQLSLNNAI